MADDYSGFVVGLYGITREACIELATQNWKAVSTGVIRMMIQDNIGHLHWYCADPIDSYVNCHGSHRMPIDIDQATNACSEDSHIVFHYK